MHNSILTETINKVNSPEGRAAKSRVRRQLDLTRHEAFDQGDMCFIYRHPGLNLEVELRFRANEGWKASCKSAGLQTTLQHQDPGSLAQALENWLNDELNVQPPSEATQTTKTIWQIFTEMVEAEQITLWPRQRKTIWESAGGKVDIYNDGYGGLRLIAINGRVTPSKPLAHNPASAAVWDWRLSDNAKGKYDLWVKSAK